MCTFNDNHDVFCPQSRILLENEKLGVKLIQESMSKLRTKSQKLGGKLIQEPMSKLKTESQKLGVKLIQGSNVRA